jgi:hypothetical protein
MDMCDNFFPKTPACKIKTLEEVERLLSEARDLWQRNEFNQAIETFLYVLDNSFSTKRYGVRRLSELIPELAHLSKTIPSLQNALIKRKEESLKIILQWAESEQGIPREWSCSFNSIDDYLEYCSHLDNFSKEPIELLEQLLKTPQSHKSVLKCLTIGLDAKLLQCGKAELLLPYMPDLLWSAVNSISMKQIYNQFPEIYETPSDMTDEVIYDRISLDLLICFEILIACSKFDTAKKLILWVRNTISTPQIYRKFSEIASKYSANEFIEILKLYY